MCILGFGADKEMISLFYPDPRASASGLLFSKTNKNKK